MRGIGAAADALGQSLLGAAARFGLTFSGRTPNTPLSRAGGDEPQASLF